MCYDISFESNMKTLGEYMLTLNTAAGHDFADREHIMAQAYSKHPVIVNEDGQLNVDMFEWGLIPAYMNTPEKIKKGRSFMCNAQSEKIIHDTKSYWHRIRKNRCLIPVTGIFEHRQVEGFKKMVPYYVHLKDRNIFCIPGLYNIGKDDKGQQTGTFTLITRGANSVMEKIHNHGDRSGRMPMFTKDRAMELRWLDPDLTDKGIDDILDY